MFEAFFGLKRRPFLANPVLDRYFPAETIEQAFLGISRVLERAEGPAALFGGAGLGKTLLCLKIAQAFQDRFEVVLLAGSKLVSRRALFQSILFELRMPYRGLSETELRLSLLDRLHEPQSSGLGLLLIVDEAQTLGLKLLEELRLLTNISVGEVPRVRLILSGSMRLEEYLAHPRMESLQQRIASRSYLRPLSAEETLKYVDHKILQCGGHPRSVFTEDAARALHRASDGIPRVIDQIADHAMVLSANLRQSPVSASVIEQAWAELQQIPAPWNDTTSQRNENSTIEFGSLDEEAEELDGHAPNLPLGVFDFDSESTWGAHVVTTNVVNEGRAADGFTNKNPQATSIDQPMLGATTIAHPSEASTNKLDRAFDAVQIQIPGRSTAKLTPVGRRDSSPVGEVSGWTSVQICTSAVSDELQRRLSPPEPDNVRRAAAFGDAQHANLSQSTTNAASVTGAASPQVFDSRSAANPSNRDWDLKDFAAPEERSGDEISQNEVVTEDIPAAHSAASTYLMRRGMGPNRVHVVSFASLERSDDLFQTDDREMIVVEEEVEQKRSVTSPTSGVKNLAPTYLQLFSRLRG